MNKTVMTVDDSKVVRKFTAKIIGELGFEVSEACDGKQALQECSKKLPICILLDWNMPVMDGLAFLKEFRKNPEHSEVIIIFCTTENEFNKINQALEYGANEYIMKPFDINIVRDKFIQTGLLKG